MEESPPGPGTPHQRIGPNPPASGDGIGQTAPAAQPEPATARAGGADRRVAARAARQRGVVTPAQLQAAGLSRSAIAHRLDRGRLHRFVAGSLLVGHAAPAPLAAETAALLMCRPDPGEAIRAVAVVCAIWGLVASGAVPHVTLARSGSSSRSGVVIHRVERLERAARAVREGFPLTSPARTLADLAGVLDRDELDAALERARSGRLVRPAEVLAAVARGPSRRGAGALRELLAERPTLTRSEAERRLLALIGRARLPAPATNVRAAGHEVDCLWLRERLVVEVDGYAYHAGRDAFERDRRRDADLLAAGHRVIRVTWRRIVDEPEAVIAAIAQALAHGPAGV